MDTRSVEHGGRSTAYRMTEDGDTRMLCVHGEGGTGRIWDPLIEISDEWSMIAIDLSGHGVSSPVDAEPGWETAAAYADDVASVVEREQPHYLIGHRLGGVVALEALDRVSEEIEGLVLIGMGLRLPVPEDMRELSERGHDVLIEYLRQPGCWFADPAESLIEHAETVMRDIPVQTLARDVETGYLVDPRSAGSRNDRPTLVLGGKADRLATPDSNRSLAEKFPQGQFQSIERTANLPMVEQPDATRRAIAAFIRENRDR